MNFDPSGDKRLRPAFDLLDDVSSLGRVLPVSSSLPIREHQRTSENIGEHRRTSMLSKMPSEMDTIAVPVPSMGQTTPFLPALSIEWLTFYSQLPLIG